MRRIMYILFDKEYYNMSTVLDFLTNYHYKIRVKLKDGFYVSHQIYRKCKRENLKTVPDYNFEGIYYIIDYK